MDLFDAWLLVSIVSLPLCDLLLLTFGLTFALATDDRGQTGHSCAANDGKPSAGDTGFRGAPRCGGNEDPSTVTVPADDADLGLRPGGGWKHRSCLLPLERHAFAFDRVFFVVEATAVALLGGYDELVLMVKNSHVEIPALLILLYPKMPSQLDDTSRLTGAHLPRVVPSCFPSYHSPQRGLFQRL